MNFCCDQLLTETGNLRQEKMLRSKIQITNELWQNYRRENWVRKTTSFCFLLNRNSRASPCISFWRPSLKRRFSHQRASFRFQKSIVAFVKWKSRIGKRDFSLSSAIITFIKLVFRTFLEQKMNALFANKRFFLDTKNASAQIKWLQTKSRRKKLQSTREWKWQ